MRQFPRPARRLAVSGQTQDQPDLTAATEPRICLGQEPVGHFKTCNAAHPATPLRTHLLEANTDVRVIQVLPGQAKLTTTARYTQVATKTIRDTVSPYKMLAKLQ